MFSNILFYFLILSVSMVLSTRPLLFRDHQQEHEGFVLKGDITEEMIIKGDGGYDERVAPNKNIFIFAIAVSVLASAAVFGFIITPLFFMCFGRSKKFKKKSRGGDRDGAGEVSGVGGQPLVSDHRDHDHHHGNNHVSVMTTGTVNMRDDHNKDPGNISDGNIDSGALRTEKKNSGQKVRSSGNGASVCGCSQDDGCGNSSGESLNNCCEIEENVNHCTHIVRKDTNMNNCEENATIVPVCGETTGEFIHDSTIDILGGQKESVTESGNKMEPGNGVDDCRHSVALLNIKKSTSMETRLPDPRFTSQTGESENVVNSGSSVVDTRIGRNWKNDVSGNSACVVSKDNDVDREDTHNCGSAIDNGDIKGCSRTEEDNCELRRNTSSFDTTKETSSEEYDEIESSEGNGAITSSNSGEMKGFLRNVERNAGHRNKTEVAESDGAEESPVEMDNDGESSEPRMNNDVATKVVDGSWKWESRGSSETTTSRCGSSGYGGGDEEWPRGELRDTGLVTRSPHEEDITSSPPENVNNNGGLVRSAVVNECIEHYDSSDDISAESRECSWESDGSESDDNNERLYRENPSVVRRLLSSIIRFVWCCSETKKRRKMQYLNEEV